MPVSHSHRFIFIRVPRTAGRSFSSAFTAQGIGLEFQSETLIDLLKEYRTREMLGLLRAIFPNDALGSVTMQHLPAVVLRKILPTNVWEQYFKFAFVRNPWDRLVSTYHWWLQLDAEMGEAFRLRWPDLVAILERSKDFSSFVQDWAMYVPPMHLYVETDTEAIAVDFIARFERLDEAVERITAETGLRLNVPHENATRHHDYRQYYTAATRRIVEEAFARDIELFGYSF